MIKIKPLASGSSGNCYYISDGSSTLLLDAGIPIKRIEIGTDFKLSEVSGALITHRHNDHCAAIKDLVRRGIKVYALPDVFDSKNLYDFNCIPVDGSVDKRFKQWHKIGTWMVAAYNVHHDVPNVGYYINSTVTGEYLLYFTDTYYISQVFPRIDYLMAECNYDADAVNDNISDGVIQPFYKKRLVQSHMSIDTLLDMLKANNLEKCKQIYLLHLSDNNSREDEFKRKVQAATGCEVYVC